MRSSGIPAVIVFLLCIAFPIMGSVLAWLAIDSFSWSVGLRLSILLVILGYSALGIANRARIPIRTIVYVCYTSSLLILAVVIAAETSAHSLVLPDDRVIWYVLIFCVLPMVFAIGVAPKTDSECLTGAQVVALMLVALLVLYGSLSGASTTGRLSNAIVNPITLGMYASYLLIYLVTVPIIRGSTTIRAFWLIACVAAVFTLVGAASKTAVISTLAILFLGSKIRKPIWFLPAAITLLIVLALPESSEMRKLDVARIGDFSNVTTAGRISLLHDAYEWIAASPWIGGKIFLDDAPYPHNILAEGFMMFGILFLPVALYLLNLFIRFVLLLRSPALSTGEMVASRLFLATFIAAQFTGSLLLAYPLLFLSVLTSNIVVKRGAPAGSLSRA